MVRQPIARPNQNPAVADGLSPEASRLALLSDCPSVGTAEPGDPLEDGLMFGRADRNGPDAGLRSPPLGEQSRTDEAFLAVHGRKHRPHRTAPK